MKKKRKKKEKGKKEENECRVRNWGSGRSSHQQRDTLRNYGELINLAAYQPSTCNRQFTTKNDANSFVTDGVKCAFEDRNKERETAKAISESNFLENFLWLGSVVLWRCA